MKILMESISGPIAAAFGWMLVHSIWQIGIVSILALLAFWLMRNKSSVHKYNVGILALTGQMAASVYTFWLFWTKFRVHSGDQTAFVSNPIIRNTYLKMDLAQPTPLMKVQFWLSTHIHELVFCWAIGAGILLFRFSIAWFLSQQLKTNALPIQKGHWHKRFEALITTLGLTKTVGFYESSRISSPLVIGAFRPVVLIPIGLLTSLPANQVEAILVHELAHIRRQDYLINMLQSVIEVIFFFHPAIWWLSEKIRTERENCCDDIALSVCSDRMSLANALVSVAEWQNQSMLAMAFASKKPQLLMRIRRVLGVDTKSAGTRRVQPLTLGIVSVLICFSLYAIGQKVDEKKGRKQARKIERILEKQMKNNVEVNKNVNLALSEPITLDLDIPNINIDLENLDIDMSSLNLDIPNITVDPSNMKVAINDTTYKRILEIQQKMEKLHEEMEPLQNRLEELHLKMEKSDFELESIQRKMEKIQLKKQAHFDMRMKLIEKHADLLENQSTKGGAKLTEAELDKQVAEIEQQVKQQEKDIEGLNEQILAIKKETETFKNAPEIISAKKEIDLVQEKIDVLAAKMEQESVYFEIPPPPPPMERPAPVKGKKPTAPPSSPKAPAAVGKVAKPAAPVAPPPPPPIKKNP